MIKRLTTRNQPQKQNNFFNPVLLKRASPINQKMKKLFLLLAAFTFGTAIFAQDKPKMKSSHHMTGKMQDCVMMEDGKMMTMMDGKTTAMDKDMTLKNGTMVMMDGTVKMKNGKTMMLKEGQCVYMNGKMGTMKMDKMKNEKR